MKDTWGMETHVDYAEQLGRRTKLEECTWSMLQFSVHSPPQLVTGMHIKPNAKSISFDVLTCKCESRFFLYTGLTSNLAILMTFPCDCIIFCRTWVYAYINKYYSKRDFDESYMYTAITSTDLFFPCSRVLSVDNFILITLLGNTWTWMAVNVIYDRLCMELDHKIV